MFVLFFACAVSLKEKGTSIANADMYVGLVDSLCESFAERNRLPPQVYMHKEKLHLCCREPCRQPVLTSRRFKGRSGVGDIGHSVCSLLE